MAKRMLEWKKQLSAIADNPDYIEQNIKAIQIELQHQHPDTKYLASKVRNIKTWLGEIDLARERAFQKARMRKVF